MTASSDSAKGNSKPQGERLVVKTIALTTGVTLEYAEWRSEAPGVPVIFLHGVTDSWRSFEAVLPELPPDIHAYALSQRGHGNSSRPPAGYRYQDMADDLRAFMDAMGLPGAVVAGHSMGSLVAQRFAIDHPKRTAGLVLIAGWATLFGHEEVKQFVESEIASLTDPIDPGVVREFQASTVARDIPAERLETAVSESLKVPAHVWREAFSAFLTTPDFSGDLVRVAAPALIVWGDRDIYAARSDQDALLAAIPKARFITYEGAGHAIHWEEPARFAADLVAFMRELR